MVRAGRDLGRTRGPWARSLRCGLPGRPGILRSGACGLLVRLDGRSRWCGRGRRRRRGRRGRRHVGRGARPVRRPDPGARAGPGRTRVAAREGRPDPRRAGRWRRRRLRRGPLGRREPGTAAGTGGPGPAHAADRAADPADRVRAARRGGGADRRPGRARGPGRARRACGARGARRTDGAGRARRLTTRPLPVRQQRITATRWQ
ncbi:hypothetical protein NOCARDAX2BIS_380051 [Nocardioides sp. AX2bis]|nr:hypothetical protein NOCARDAX2BIS_380051 [Nocardioides sp. AX2bis]